MSTTKILIHDALLHCSIGVSDEERAHPQPVILNVVCTIKRPSTDDMIESTVDYGEALAAIRELTAAPYTLLETLADDCLATCFRFPGVTHASIQLEKPHKLPNCGSVGVLREADNTEPPVHTIFLALGSNVGDRLDQLGQATKRLRKAFGMVVTSPIYETRPVGRISQPTFYNQVVKIYSSCSPREILKTCKKIEHELGRQDRGTWGPREIDIDVLLHGNHLIESKTLTIPHVEMHKRDFVLQPLADLAPNQLHPRLRKSIQQILAGLPLGERTIIRTVGTAPGHAPTESRRKTHVA
jgi:dihydroneopterin aldolase / 2-amino-4-hydroxy-6-hydroxymethyldihydropteridine diphosphokinase